MDEILCRLCLSPSSPSSLQYLSSTLTQKIEGVFPVVQVIENDFLPKKVCSSCTEKIDEMHNFQLKIAANQNLLLQYLNEGVRNLNEFLFILKNNFMKFETKYRREKSLEPETDTLNIVIKEEKHNKHNEEQVMYTNIPIENEKLIREEIFKADDYIYSDDNIPLSSDDIVKKEKVLAKKKKVAANRNKEKFLPKIKKEKVSVKKTRKKDPRKKKKENVGAKIKKENKNHPNPPDERKVMTCESKKEFDNNTDESDVQNDTHNENDRFKCLTCFTLLDNKYDLLNHYRKEHASQEAPESSQERRYSKVKYKDEYRFKCEKCEYMHHVRWFIQRHVKSHNDKRPFNCKICGRTYKSALEIYWHGRAHTTAKWQCFYRCGFATAYKGALKIHEAVHRAEYRYTCDKCSSGFHTRIELMEHQNKHDGIRPFVCDICGCAYHIRRYLQSHKSRLHPQSSSVKRYLCVHCSLPCDTMNALNEHMKVEHEKRTEYLCELCGKTLTTQEKLSQHKRVHTGAKNYECNICGKRLTRKCHLIIHINGHTRERCFRCKCGKKYVQKSALIRHQRTRCRHYVGKSDELLELFEAESAKGFIEAAKSSTKVDESQEATSPVEANKESS